MKIKFPPQVTADLLNSGYGEHLLPQAFGINFTAVGEDFVKASLVVSQQHLRPGGIANGGVFLVLLETLGSVSACLSIDMEKYNALGIQVTANHTGSAKLGDQLLATSRAIHVGRSTHIWEVDVENQAGKLISTGRITLLIVPR
jgi:1,4-dihydroxy-2-naphthoyl-CoA hydrolase